MTSIIISNVLPDIISPVNVAYSRTLQDAYSVLYYYKGGNNVVCIQRSSSTVFTVYIPLFSTVDAGKVVETISNLEKDIVKEELALAIPIGRYFLFDIGTKKIVTMDSLIDFIPAINTKNTIFILQNEDGSYASTIMYLADQTDWGVLQFVPISIAKRELLRPKLAINWSSVGKGLLTYLVSKRYAKKGDFSLLTGCWDSPDYRFNPKQDHHPTVNLEKLIITRAAELCTSIDYAEYARYLGGSEANYNSEPDMKSILLSSVLQFGVKSYCTNAYDSTINVEIDVLKETYKLIWIDTKSGVVFVELNPGIDLTEDRIKEDLEASEVNLVTTVYKNSEGLYE